MKAHPRRQAGRRAACSRALWLEPLEDRQLLSAWTNPVYPLDVNNDSVTTPSDALAIINRLLSDGGGELPDPPPTPPRFFYDTSGNGNLTAGDALRVINALLAPPEIAVSSLTPFVVDLTPAVTVTTTATSAIADGTVLDLDVDLNGDGDFGDDFERGYTQSTFFANSSTFEINPGLTRTFGQYDINLRARAKNAHGVVATSPVIPMRVDTTPSTALEDYVNTPDPSYRFEHVSTTPGAGFSYHVLDMTSQTWRSEADVNKPVWKHWVQMYVPDGVIESTALLLINGGSNTSSPNAINNDFGQMAVTLRTVMIDLKIVPNEPVIFTDETRTRTEDEIIAYTFDKFMANIGEPGNETWPLLLPMVKSAVRAMDTVQTYVPTVTFGQAIDDFIVTGHSKRGWTTWLTSAVDDRVRAIIPGVFDNLNQAPQMVHHYGVYGFFSEAVHDYEDLEIFRRLLTAEAQKLSPITDPYRYLFNGRFDDMPKLVLNSPGDEFFVSDSAQFYFHDIPGEQNYLRYFPNTGHGLNAQQVINSTVSFYDAIVNDRTLPEYSWTVTQDGKIHAQVGSLPSQVLLWQATNPVARDFRHFLVGNIWTSTPLSDQGGGVYVGDVPMPANGATQYFIEFTFPNAPLLPSHVFTTEVRVKSPLPFHPWPFEIDLPEEIGFAAAAAPLVDDGGFARLRARGHDHRARGTGVSVRRAGADFGRPGRTVDGVGDFRRRR
jgi:PhoPQ-activated pathogenicity-related protein